MIRYPTYLRKIDGIFCLDRLTLKKIKLLLAPFFLTAIIFFGLRHEIALTRFASDADIYISIAKFGPADAPLPFSRRVFFPLIINMLNNFMEMHIVFVSVGKIIKLTS